MDINGVFYALEHLNCRMVVLEKQGKDQSDIVVRISFLSHVFSKSPKFGEIFDFKDENGKGRIFCLNRYTYSLNLAEFCENSISQNWLTWESRDKNSVSSYMLATDSQGINYAIIYRLAFGLSESCDVEFIVKSAYVTNSVRNNPRKFNVKSLIKKCYFEEKGFP